jgi:hypothetical protein
MRTLLLDMSSRHNLGRQMEPFTEVVESLGGQRVVVPLPGEPRLEVPSRGQRLAGFDDVEVLGVNFAVLRQVEVFFGDEDALCFAVLLAKSGM